MLDTSRHKDFDYSLMFELEEKMKEEMAVLEYQLIFNQTESLFSVVDKLPIYSNQVMQLAITWARGNSINYNNIQTKERLMQKDTYGKFFLVALPNIGLQWNLTSENKKIGSYNCFRATTIKTYETGQGKKTETVIAWYTPEIPFSHGPIDYEGLPGLIVELNFKQVNYVLKRIDFEPTKTFKIIKPNKGKPITLKEYEKWLIENSGPPDFGN
jgi:GLPGLI family protein